MLPIPSGNRADEARKPAGGEPRLCSMRQRYEMPKDVFDALTLSQVIGDYEARPAYQRNDYFGWITRAGKAETRQKRIDQMIAELKAGGVYMKMAHPASAK